MKSIIVKLPNWMGDILFAYDLLFSLSAYFNRIGLCTSEEHAELFSIFPIPRAELIIYPSNEWPFLTRDSLLKIEKFDSDVGLLLPNSFGSAVAFRFAGVSQLYGYDSEHRGFLLKDSLPVPAERIHQSEYYLRLLKLFCLNAVAYPIVGTETRSPKSVASRLVVIHPGASKIERAWNLERFLKVAEALEQKGFEILFVSGQEISVEPYRLLIKPSLNNFADILKRSALFVGNDSGPLHLAQQCGTPVVGIYGPGDPRVTGPRSVSTNRIVYHAFPCSPCRQRFFKECDPAPTNKPYCIETISTVEVLRAASELLQIE